MSVTPVKYCPFCGVENWGIASFCGQCDGDLMHAPLEVPREKDVLLSEAIPEPVTQRVESREEALRLVLEADLTVSFTVYPGQTVGRSAKADVVLSGVPEIEYISRVHARFTRRRAQWYVQYIAAGNSITVDGVESGDDAELAIYDESLLLLSFTAFRTKLS